MMIVLPGILTQSYDNYKKDSTDLEMFLSDLEVNKRKNEKALTFQLKPFDPNNVTEAKLIQMNLPAKVVSNLIKYRQKGGYFREKQQFRKIYGLTDSMYNQISPFIIIESRKSETLNKNQVKEVTAKESNLPTETNTRKNKKEIISFDLNQADTSVLKIIYGVGDVLSARIVKYRKALGGFVNKEQLTEVYGLSPEVVNNISQKSYIEAYFEPVKININFASVTELKRHPYLNYQETIKIVNYRSKNGPFKDLEDLRSSGVLTEDKVKLIHKYVSF